MNFNKFRELYNYEIPNELLNQIEYRKYGVNDFILKIGDQIDGLYFLLEGKYYVSSLEITGKELLLRYSKRAAILGDIEFFENCTIQSNCIAVEECEFAYISRNTYDKYLKNDIKFKQLLLEELAYKLRTCTISSRVIALSPVSVRLAAYYCTLESMHSNSEYINSKTLDEIASLIGTTKRHLNRILKKWSEEDIISRDGDNVKILDWSMIDEYSNGVRFE